MTEKGEYVYETSLLGKQRSSPKNPFAVAQEFLAEWMGERLVWRGDFYRYTGTHWQLEDRGDVMSEINRELGASIFEEYNETTRKTRMVAWSPNNTSLSNLETQLMLQAALPSTQEPVRGGEYVFLENGRLVIMTRGLLDHDPSIFNLHASPFPYDPKAQCPVFDRFLSETFAGDQESIDTHLRWMAYELSGRGDLQKGYFLLGPTRSGKGTLSHISDALLGLSQVTAMSLRDFGTDFGMAALVGKSVCRINDARDAGTATGAAVERLLGIIGGDHVQINRKNKDAWVGQLGVRFTIASNEELRLPDASGAIINRFIFNRTETSHLGREDTTLLGRILEREMPGVLNRVLDHIDRLDEEWPKNDRVMETISSMRAAASPITAWIQDRGLLVGSVLVGYRYSMPKGEAFSEYSSWAYENGYQRMNSATFGRHLRAAIPLGKDTFPGPKGKQVPHYTGIGTMEEGCRCSACMG